MLALGCLSMHDHGLNKSFGGDLAIFSAAIGGFMWAAQRDIIAFFSKANIVMSTQPVMYDNAITPRYREAFAPDAVQQDLARLEEADDAFMSDHKADRCGTAVAPAALGYFLGKSWDKLERFVGSAGIAGLIFGTALAVIWFLRGRRESS